MKLIILLVTVGLTACVSVPVERTFPKAPEELMQTCPDLKLINPTNKLSDVVDVVTTNYGQYQECQFKSAAWIEWYNKQKEIFNSIK
jgi:hypothetical protein